jgi:hypothetical protein
MKEVVSFFLYPPFTGWLGLLRIIFLFFSLLFLIGIFSFLFKTSWLKAIFFQDLIEFLSFKPYQAKKTKKWKKVLYRLETGLESEAKLALIESEMVLDEVLKESGYPGENLGEKLGKITVASLPNIEEVKEAHKIRDNIIHDPAYKLTLEEAERTIKIYEKALKDLEAL